MKPLMHLLRRKLIEEALTESVEEDATEVSKDLDNAGVSAAVGKGTLPSRCCWLCGKETALRFRMKDTNVLCFSCFHIAYVAMVLPILGTPERRAEHQALVNKIESLQQNPDAEPERGNAEATSPPHEPGLPHHNVDFFASIGRPQERAWEVSPSVELPLAWACEACAHANPTESDCCLSCNWPRSWNCRYCTVRHDHARGLDGLWLCPTCEKYSTAEDLVLGQRDVELEEHRQSGGAAVLEDEKSVVFGVNDAETLLERERQVAIEKNASRLRERLARLELECCVQKDDGNCLFAALAYQLFGKAQLHAVVRSCVVAYIKENEPDYRIFFHETKAWQEYLSHMNKTGVWGDEICLNAAARCFCVDIHVITSDPTRWHLVFQHDQLGNSVSKLRQGLQQQRRASASLKQPAPAESPLCVFLAYKSPVHYDAIKLRGSLRVTLSDLLIPELNRMMREEHERGTRAAALAKSPGSRHSKGNDLAAICHENALTRHRPLTTWTGLESGTVPRRSRKSVPKVGSAKGVCHIPPTTRLSTVEGCGIPLEQKQEEIE